jgi:CII-binding regulator of phage lambda lysogenization HflD
MFLCKATLWTNINSLKKMFETHSHEVHSDRVLNMKMGLQLLFETYYNRQENLKKKKKKQ